MEARGHTKDQAIATINQKHLDAAAKATTQPRAITGVADDVEVQDESNSEDDSDDYGDGNNEADSDTSVMRRYSTNIETLQNRGRSEADAIRVN